MDAFSYIITWFLLGGFLVSFGLCLLYYNRYKDMEDYADYVSGNNSYFGERMEDRNKEVDNLQQDISYYLNRLALYKAFLAENDMVEKFIHWRPTITVKKESVPPWEDEMDEALDETLAIRLRDRSRVG